PWGRRSRRLPCTTLFRSVSPTKSRPLHPLSWKSGSTSFKERPPPVVWACFQPQRVGCSNRQPVQTRANACQPAAGTRSGEAASPASAQRASPSRVPAAGWQARSEEHTSELQSRFDLVCRRLLEKKKDKKRSAVHR